MVSEEGRVESSRVEEDPDRSAGRPSSNKTMLETINSAKRRREEGERKRKSEIKSARKVPPRLECAGKEAGRPFLAHCYGSCLAAFDLEEHSYERKLCWSDLCLYWSYTGLILVWSGPGPGPVGC